MEERICVKCNEVKSIDNYSKYKYKPKKDGTQKIALRKYCNNCKNKITKDWFDKNKDYKKKWRKEKPERVKQENRKRQKKHNKWSQKSRDKLTDSYVIGQITKRSILTAEIVRKIPELIEAKKIIIKTKRLCKTSQN
jgi:uncharacterized protein (UPF0262 family)|tara:strand:- start:226 stop:636 length:411 start_codon:yes stop_codon:yes gene_type:complete